MKNLNIIIIFVCLVFGNYSFGQERCIKVLNVNEIKYYYIYSVFDTSSNDTLRMISSKLDKEFKILKLDKDEFYDVSTRIKSAIKISEEEYLFCKHAINEVEGIKISDENKLPVLILDYKKVRKCGNCTD